MLVLGGVELQTLTILKEMITPDRYMKRQRGTGTLEIQPCFF